MGELKTICLHCKEECEPVELEEETLAQIDMLGPESLPEVQQAIWEGFNFCESCYYKEMGL